MLRSEREYLGHGLHAVAVWDQGWKSYNNFYIIDRPGQLTLIDTGKPGHLEALTGALAALEHRLDGVDLLIATHGHTDHIGSAAALPRAVRAIHPAERATLPAWQQALFPIDLPDHGIYAGFQVRWLPPAHTPGSVAVYDRESHALFCGDLPAFFGDPLPAAGICGTCNEVRQSALAYMENWRERTRRTNPVQPDKALAVFREGLDLLAEYSEAQLLCSGHGPVLRGDIAAFLRSLAAAAAG